MYDQLIARLGVMASVARAAFGAIFGALIGALIEFVKWGRDNHRRWNRRIDRLQTQIDRIKASLGLTGISDTTFIDRSPISTGTQVVDVTAAATWLFGASNSVSSAPLAAGGVPTGILARKFRQLLCHISVALGAGASFAITAQYSVDLGASWTALGTGSLALAANAAAGMYAVDLAVLSGDVDVPANALVRFTAVAAGDPAATVGYTFFLR